MLKIFDKDHNPVGYIRKYVDLCKESVLDTADKTLSFTYLAKNHKIEHEYYIQDKDDEYVVKEIRESTDGYPVFTAILNTEELDGKAWESFQAKEATPREIANLALAGTGWIVDVCEIDKKRSMGLTKCNSRTILEKICLVFLCEMTIDSKGKKVSFYEKAGQDKGVYFTKELNLKKLNLTSDTLEYYTRMIPIGKDGLKITAVNDGKDYLENYQYSNKVLTYIWEDSSYEDAASLMEDAKARLDDMSKPKKAYSGTVRDLAKQNSAYSILSYGIGDTITLIDRATGIKDKQRIVKMKEYPQNPEKNTFEIANTTYTAEAFQQKLREAASIVEAVTNADGTVNGSAVDKINSDQILGFEDSVNSTVENSETIAKINGDIVNIAGELNVVKETVGTLDATYVKAAEIEGKYAQFDFANVTAEHVGNLFAKVGILTNVTINEGFVTGELNSVKVNADVISGGTLSVERLLITGQDSIVYQINAQSSGLSVEELSDEKYQKYLNGTNIVASSITGGQIAAETIKAHHIESGAITTEKLDANVVTTEKIAADAIKSKNYVYSEGEYAAAGSFFNLADGSIRSKNFSIDAEGNVSFKGKLESATGSFSGDVSASTITVNERLNLKTNAGTKTVLESTDLENSFRVGIQNTSGEWGTWIDSSYIDFIPGTENYDGCIDLIAGNVKVQGNLEVIYHTVINGMLEVNQGIYDEGVLLSNKYLAKTGGTLSGNIAVVINDNNYAQVVTQNSLHNGRMLAASGGTFGLQSITHNKWLVSCDVNGNVSLNGTAVMAAQLSTTIGDGTITAVLRKSGNSPTQGLSIVTTTSAGSSVFHSLLSVDSSGNITRQWVYPSEVVKAAGGTFTGDVIFKANPIVANGTYIRWYNSSGSTVQVMRMDSNDVVAIGNTSYITVLKGSSVRLSSSTGTVVTSDRRLKQDINEITENYINAFKEMDIVQFRYTNNSNKEHVGVIYQDVKKVFEKYGIYDFAGIEDPMEKVSDDDDCLKYGGVVYEQFHNIHMAVTQRNMKEISAMNEWKLAVDKQFVSYEDRLNDVVQQLKAIIAENGKLRKKISDLQTQLQIQA